MLSPIRRLDSARLVHRLYSSSCAFQSKRHLSKWTFSQRNLVARRSNGIPIIARQRLRFSSTKTGPQLPRKVEPNYLPVTCPGCGAYAQWITPGEAGYYDLKRSLVKEYIRQCQREKLLDAPEVTEAEEKNGSEEGIAATEPPNIDTKLAPGKDEVEPESNSTHSEPTEKNPESNPENDSSSTQPASSSSETTPSSQQPESQPASTNEPKPGKKDKQNTKGIISDLSPKPAPVCDRCNQLVNHTSGESIPYPPLSYISDIMAETPFKDNHVYHVIDAADFPLSVIPHLEHALPLASLRSKNRRSLPTKYAAGGKLASLNFIITRSDLLGRSKEDVDTFMSTMMTMLRDTLGSKGAKVRLGNVHMVSTNRGWWTREVKEKLWEHGGAIWLVGKANVGKSKLMSSIFPKSAPESSKKIPPLKEAKIVGRSNKTAEKKAKSNDDLSEDGLLPPVRQETNWPEFPIDSTRSGTTASPIRLPFDNHRGELIDLPGLHRTGLDKYVRPELQPEIVMERFIRAKRQSLAPGRSIIFGGLVRVTGITDDIFMTIPFVPLESHATSTVKAEEKYQGNAKLPIKDLSIDNVHEHMKSAGIFELKYEVTKEYDTNPKRIRWGVELYKLYGIDILIEGVGWIEFQVQVRTKDRHGDEFPKIEVFSPEGKFIGSRPPICAWSKLVNGKPKRKGNKNVPAP